ncbi:hypothetical protein K432DRAFT_402615 [Lepidopterella palustris CBS 459.81]|uniref:Uncharacterized protein n=1 Tax=Lepidopterella palustris CBS 459.81 TaxID=1314670 RepID=A0A8E2EEV2_9PEZI|nr:hypothetical protein K432DRAFT_402615 [Lepidopterella palustris CBS 459.81]
MASTSIPLHCNICPKKPNFSDVSHLLTHIASKGHLSHYYKVKVRSSGEDASRRLIETYDGWYAQWNVEDLMSERMSQKEKRRTRTRAPARANSTPSVAAPPPRTARPRATLDVLDPRLSERPIKTEASHTPTPPPAFDPASRHRSFAPRMQLWPTSRSTSHSYTSADFDNSSETSDPSERRGCRYNGLQVAITENDDTTTVTTEESTISECTKLKGVYWPGMDIFDSATPEMRRKRNQKKDVSVVEQLELNSQEVEPTELIFTPLGSFKKQRRISGSVYDDSSPVKLETTPKKSYLSRPVLADMDINCSRRTRQHARHPTLSNVSRNVFDDDDQAQLEFGYDDFSQKKKRGFEVFQDQEVSFAHPAGFNYLTSEFHYPQPTQSPAFPFKPYVDPYEFGNKENMESFYQQPAYFPNGLPYHSYHQSGGHEQQGLFHNPLYFSSYHPQEEEADDQRTLTAPPSPSTG